MNEDYGVVFARMMCRMVVVAWKSQGVATFHLCPALPVFHIASGSGDAFLRLGSKM
jgi:hypothetical protein